MFALWYIALAIDELRKYLGWNSFSDIFNNNKTAKQMAIDNTPSLNKSNETKVRPLPITSKPLDVPAKPIVTHDTKEELPKQKPEVSPPPVQESATIPIEPKSPEIPKPADIVAPTPAPTPAPTQAPVKELTPSIPTPPPTKPSISPSRNEPSPNDLDKKLFSPPKGLENGDAPNSNVKDATSSFLAGEGQASSLNRSES